jgi:Partial alpha/beta-hydrolase lipase region
MRGYESDPALDNDVNKSLKEIIMENGFSYEEYTLVTKDKYILTLHRIPGKIGEPESKKPVVLL